MKDLSILVVSGVVLSLILIGGAMLVFPAQTPDQPAIVVQVNPTITYLEQALVEQEATYQAELATQEKNLEQQEATYQAQIETLNRKISAAEQELARLKIQEVELLGRLEQLKNERAEKLQTYRDGLAQARADHLARQNELQTRLTQLQAELSAVNIQLKQ